MTDTTTIDGRGSGQPSAAGSVDAREADGVRPSQVLGAAAGAVWDLHDALWAAKPPDELLATMRAAERLRSTLDAIQLQVIAEIDATSAARREGWASTKDFVTAVTGGLKGTGRRLVALARALSSDRLATGAALADGRISRVQAEVIVGAVDRLPVHRALRLAAEALLVSEAGEHDATELTRCGRHVADRLDPEGSERRDELALEREERAAHLSRFLSIAEDGIGGVRLTGRGTVEDAAWLKTVLFPLAAPRPSQDPRACGSTPATGSGQETGGRGDHVGACGIADCAHDGRDPREHGARLWDALIEAVRTLSGTDLLPESHGTRPRLSVSVDLDTLRTGLGDASIEVGGSLSASAVRALACDAELLPVVLGSRSQVLDVGRTSRLVTVGLWLALVVRDRHCAFPGCSRPPAACDAHHIVHWVDGGATSLSNLALLCRAHHTVLHSTPWEVRLASHDHRPEFLPPPVTGRDRAPLRRRPLRE